MIIYYQNSQPITVILKSCGRKQQLGYLVNLEISKFPPQRSDCMVWGETQKFVFLMGTPGKFEAESCTLKN